MRLLPTLLLLASILALALTPAVAAKREKVPLDAPPRLISTESGGPKQWKNTKQLRAHAAQGDPLACFELGTRLLNGDDEVPADLAQARVLLETAAKGGIGDAQFRLGKIYHDARGVPRDYAKALEYYTAAARRGVPEAQHNIGAMLVSARGVKRDYVEGLAWLLVAEHSGAASDASVRVRDRLARRPADVAAAEKRAKDLLADLPNATVRTGATPTAAVAPPRPSRPAPVSVKSVPAPALAPPAREPIGPIRLAPPAVPTPVPAPAPR